MRLRDNLPCFKMRIQVSQLPGVKSFVRSRVTQLVKKFPALYGTEMFITVFTRASLQVTILSHMHHPSNIW